MHRNIIKIPVAARNKFKSLTLAFRTVTETLPCYPNSLLQVCKLPSMSSVLKDIKSKEDKEVGVLPAILKLLLTDPRLGLTVVFGPCTPYQFRLCGPGRWEGARQAILTQWERVAQPLKTRCVPEQESHHSSPSLMFSVSVAALLSALYYSRASLYTLISDPSVILDKIRAYVPLPVPIQ